MCRASRVCDEAPNRAAMIARAIAAEVPFAYVAADSVYGIGDIETCCAAPARAMCWASPAIMCSVPGARRAVRRHGRRNRAELFPALWRRLSAGEGTKGRACTTGPISNWPISMPANTTSQLTGEWTRGLLIRRNIADGDLAFFSTWCPAGTPMEKLVAVEGHRWAIEDSFETAKNEFGLDHNETRSWHGWHRHVSLVMLAFAMMAAIRHHANATRRPKKPPTATSSPQSLMPDPLVDPGNPPYRHQARATAHPTRPRHRLVTLATRPSSRAPEARISNEKRNCNARLRTY